MKRHLLALALAAAAPASLLSATASAAEGLSYNYVQGGYAATNTDGADADGWGVDGSVAVHPNFHLFGAYTKQDIDHSNADFDQWRAGVGYNTEISPKVDLLARVAYEKFDAGHGFDFDGYNVETGVRASLLPNLEGYALAGYQRYDDKAKYVLDDNHDFYGRLGAQLKFNQNWGISADAKLIQGGDTQWTVGPRVTW
ncbi:Ax21 family protein [Luteimonas aquatica]|uniref:OmpO family porin n=1 Tax=Luteimonas aquatica TaxID=450364 RepID=UPI001F59722C|nr:Ax21 family protein [Luteimonas aquatica]